MEWPLPYREDTIRATAISKNLHYWDFKVFETSEVFAAGWWALETYEPFVVMELNDVGLFCQAWEVSQIRIFFPPPNFFENAGQDGKVSGACK